MKKFTGTSRQSALKKSAVQDRFENVYVVDFDDSDALNDALRRYQTDPNVDYVAINHSFNSDAVKPNDTHVDSLYWIKLVQAMDAWNLQKGSRDVLIGIIDSGIDYQHPDLSNQIWHNSGETGMDPNGHDRRTNGIDDDGNGYVDDWRGWDFVDAPGFADNGDFLEPDNDPLDDNGHGTAVAGIIGAEGNNHTGVIGLAYGCTIMPLRAGSASGFLQEDDVAQAIIYAVDNGARVINMSFGDKEFSPLMRDAIRYAYEHDVVMVASAGNDASSAYHYPSGFDETISVSATGPDDFFASFSNYGISINIAAPGVNVYSTSRGGGYTYFSGTSASAPLVSALAALIISHHPEFNAEEIKSIVETSADDIGENGWDQYYGAGRLNAFRALQIAYASIARINFPATDQGVAADTLAIVGTASGAFLKRYSVYYGVGSNPSNWILLQTTENHQIVNARLAALHMQPLAEGPYSLRLVIENKDGSIVEDRSRFFIDRSAPIISEIVIKKMIFGNGHGYLIEFQTDDPCASTVWYRSYNTVEPFKPIPINALSTKHIVFIPDQYLSGHFDIFLEARNAAGMNTLANNAGAYYELLLDDQPIEQFTFVQDTSIQLPSSYLLDHTTDLDSNGKKELVVNALNTNHGFEQVKIFEFDPIYPGKFRLKKSYDFNGIPRDAFRANGIGKILTGAGAETFIITSNHPDSLPNTIPFRDNNDFWGVRFDDVFSNNDTKMIVKNGKNFKIYRDSGGDEWKLTATLNNPTNGDNFIAIPSCSVGDFDGDGKKDLLFGDFDGDVYIYEVNGQNLDLTWQESLPLYDVNGFTAAADFDGDGKDEFIAGTHTLPFLSESQAAEQYWTFVIYKSTGDNIYEPVWQQNFYGFSSLTDFQSGVNAADIDGDGKAEIFLSLYPNLYVLSYNSTLQTYEPIWQTQTRSNTVVIDDMNGDSIKEIYFNNGHQTVAYSLNGLINPAQTPSAFAATPLDTFQVLLSWNASPSAELYKIYRGTALDSMEFAFNVTAVHTDTLDTSVTINQLYYYGITAIVSGIESDLSPVQTVRPNRKPYIVSAQASGREHVIVKFSEKMDVNKLTAVGSYELNSVGFPMTALPKKNGEEVLLTFPSITPGNYWLTVNDITDTDRTPIDTTLHSIEITIPLATPKFFLEKTIYLGNNSIDLYFSEAVTSASAGNIINYSVEPDFQTTEAAIDAVNPKTVHIKITGSHPIGAIGIRYIIKVKNLMAESGSILDETEGNTSSIVLTQNTLDHVFTYPNPYRPDEAPQGMMFANLTPTATIKIYSLNGVYINTLEETDQDGGVLWDLKDRSGNKVPSGIYYYIVESEKQKKRGKFAVVR
ncbi:S8 family serine peptidase [bacterium]|nr:S8 family serine peptidase [bacterium]